MSFSPKTDSGPQNQLELKGTHDTKKTSSYNEQGKPASDGKYKTFDKKSKLDAMSRRLGK